jgi:hypothetical protein
MRRARLVFLLSIFAALAVVPARAAELPEFPPPANDNQSKATKIDQLPTAATLDFFGATTEPGEDTMCGEYSYPKTVWYAYRSSAAATLEVFSYQATRQFDVAEVHVYRKDFDVMSLVL